MRLSFQTEAQDNGDLHTRSQDTFVVKYAMIDESDRIRIMDMCVCCLATIHWLVLLITNGYVNMYMTHKQNNKE